MTTSMTPQERIQWAKDYVAKQKAAKAENARKRNEHNDYMIYKIQNALRH